MRTIIVLLILSALASAQVTARHEVVTGTKIVEYVSMGKMISADKTANGKTVKLTVMDAEFAAIAKGRPIDTDKSIAACAKDLIETAKKNKVIIELTNDKGQKIKFDLEKENEKSVYNGIQSALKSGYKKPAEGNGSKQDKPEVNKQK